MPNASKKANIQNARVWSKESYIDQEGTKFEKMRVGDAYSFLKSILKESRIKASFMSREGTMGRARSV